MGVWSCTSGPTPEGPPPPSQVPQPNAETGYTRIISGAGDSTGALPGSADALYRYRFRQVEPASDRFTFRDRDLTFYFKPTPFALHFQVENLQDRPVWIDWDQSTFYAPLSGTRKKVAHATTRYRDRFGTQAPTQILGLQKYGDYVFPLDDLVDPVGSDEQLHLILFPEDATAVQYSDRIFGVDLMIRIEGRLKPYVFRFRVASVLPR